MWKTLITARQTKYSGSLKTAQAWMTRERFYPEVGSAARLQSICLVSSKVLQNVEGVGFNLFNLKKKKKSQMYILSIQLICEDRGYSTIAQKSWFLIECKCIIVKSIFYLSKSLRSFYYSFFTTYEMQTVTILSRPRPKSVMGKSQILYITF